MEFKDFAQRLGGVIRGESSTSAFTRTLFESILQQDRLDVLDEYQPSSYKAYYNGQSKITRIARKINGVTDPDGFADFIYDLGDGLVQKICAAFCDILPGITLHNAGNLLGNRFDQIISEAAADNKKSASNGADRIIDGQIAIVTDEASVVPDLAEFKDGVLYLSTEKGKDERDAFEKFVEKAVEYYSAKKTLLYAEKPRPFYSLYVCNDLRYHKQRIIGAKDPKPETTISNASVESIENESRYIIIQGTGGIGKSMFLTHLFLSSAEDYDHTGRLTILISLKDYKESTLGIVDLAWKAIKEFDSSVAQKYVIEMFEKRKVILLLDGLDEIQSALRDSFNKDLEAFIKSYAGNTVFITSRPVYSFVSYTKFSLFDIEPLSKAQALSLVEKLEFWDEKGKNDFITALDNNLYFSHRQFASNPLLLTIMLMTFSTFGEVPAKMHVFYSKAYETMARLHDATKGSYQRPLHTGLTPEDFAKYFAQFCARTYTEEMLEFTEMSFASYMDKVITRISGGTANIKAKDFLLDLTDNLCIMYCEGGKYYFIHRSFQEYFAAVYFASDFEGKLTGVGKYFDGQQHRSYTDRTFDMLYDMIPEKVERFIFLPYLKELLTKCAESSPEDEYWAFLEEEYPYLYHEQGDVGDSNYNEPQSFIYKFLVGTKGLEVYTTLDLLEWPGEILNLPTRIWVSAYSRFTEKEAYEKYTSPDLIKEGELDEKTVVAEDELPYQYSSFFGDPDPVGQTTEIEIYELRKNPKKHAVIRSFMEADEFPLVEEFRRVKAYCEELSARTERELASKSLFDD